MKQKNGWLSKLGIQGVQWTTLHLCLFLNCHNESDKERKKKREREEVKEAEREKQR